jgi:Protein of unknown function (DUF2878)
LPVRPGGVGLTHPAANFLAYQAGWFACVLGGAHGHPWLGAGTAVALTAAHLLSVSDRRGELRLVALAALVGLLADSLQQRAGLLAYASPLPILPWIAPPWIVAMWAQFATTLRCSLRWLGRRPALVAPIGVVLGPLAFRAGAALGAVRFAPDAWRSYLSLAVVWGIALPLLVGQARRGITDPEPASAAAG